MAVAGSFTLGGGNLELDVKMLRNGRADVV